jgi:hypothetical protein
LPSLNERFYDLLAQWQLPPEHAIQLAAPVAWSVNATLSDETMQLVERYRLLPTDACPYSRGIVSWRKSFRYP